MGDVLVGVVEEVLEGVVRDVLVGVVGDVLVGVVGDILVGVVGYVLVGVVGDVLVGVVMASQFIATARSCGGPLGTGKGEEERLGQGCAHGTSYPF